MKKQSLALQHIGYIKIKINPKDGKQYRWMRQILDILDQSNEPEEFLEHTKMQMHADQVFVFTPKGDIVALPKGQCHWISHFLFILMWVIFVQV